MSLRRPSSLDVQFVDFDGVRFHLSTPERKTVLLLSMNIRCWDELVKYGAMEVLQREYGPLLVGQVESDYNVSLQIDLEQVPTDSGASRGLNRSGIFFADQSNDIRSTRRICHVCIDAQA